MATGDSTDALCFIECRPNDGRECGFTLRFSSCCDFCVPQSLCASDSDLHGGDWSESDVLSSIAVVLTVGGCIDGGGGAFLMTSVMDDFSSSAGVFSVIRTGGVGVFGDFGGNFEKQCTLGSATLNEKERKKKLKFSAEKMVIVVVDFDMSRRGWNYV